MAQSATEHHGFERAFQQPRRCVPRVSPALSSRGDRPAAAAMRSHSRLRHRRHWRRHRNVGRAFSATRQFRFCGRAEPRHAFRVRQFALTISQTDMYRRFCRGHYPARSLRRLCHCRPGTPLVPPSNAPARSLSASSNPAVGARSSTTNAAQAAIRFHDGYERILREFGTDYESVRSKYPHQAKTGRNSSPRRMS